MLAVALSVLAFAVVGHAQNTTVSLLIPIADNQSLLGSIAGSDAAATTYIVQCPPGAETPSEEKRKRQASATSASNDARVTEGPRYPDNTDSDTECGFPEPITITQGESTLHLEYSFQEISGTIDCQLAGTTQAVCAANGGSPRDNSSGDEDQFQEYTITSTLVASEIPPFIPVVITAGASTTENSSGSSSRSSGSISTPTTSAGSSSTSGGAVAQETGGSGGMHIEPALGVGIAGIIAIGLAAVML